MAILTGNGSTFCAGMGLAELGKLSTGKPNSEWMERALQDLPIISGAWLKTARQPSP